MLRCVGLGTEKVSESVCLSFLFVFCLRAEFALAVCGLLWLTTPGTESVRSPRALKPLLVEVCSRTESLFSGEISRVVELRKIGSVADAWNLETGLISLGGEAASARASPKPLSGLCMVGVG